MEGDKGSSSVKLLSATQDAFCRIHQEERFKCRSFVHEEFCRIHEENLRCGGCMHGESVEDSVMEGSCDSESVMDSDQLSPPFTSHFAVGYNELDRLFIADDEQSTTSSSEEVYCGCGDEVGEATTDDQSSSLEYILRASDEELGIPSTPPNNIADYSPISAIDLDFDVVDGCKRAMADADRSYWLSCLAN